ncbi:MAG: hypothetical protein QXL88_02055 [Candidatus Pacearchaeota archaeon]
MKKQEVPEIYPKDELAYLTKYYKEKKDEIKYGIVGELYILELCKSKELRDYLRGSENALEAAIESGAALYLNKLDKLSIDDYILMFSGIYEGPELEIFSPLKGRKIGEFAEGHRKYIEAKKKYEEAGKNKNEEDACKAIEEMKKYETNFEIYSVILNIIDLWRLKCKYGSMVAKEGLKEGLRGLEKILSKQAR